MNGEEERRDAAITRGILLRMLMPVARLSLGAGLGVGEVIEALKIAVATVAETSARINGRPNVSAIATRTGLTRKEIRPLLARATGKAQYMYRRSASQRTARVVAGWRADKQFRNVVGRPAPLKRNGPNQSFQALARRYAGDVPASSLLRELVRLRAVKIQRNGKIRLRKANLQFSEFGADTLADISTRISDLATTMVRNIEHPDRPIYTGVQEIESLPSEAATLFHRTFSERAGALLDGVARWAELQRVPPGRRVKGPKGRVGIGIYLFDDTEPTAQREAASAGSTRAPARARRKLRPSQ